MLFGFVEIVDSFEEVWSLYPRRLGKKQAHRHYKAQIKTRQDHIDLLKAMDNYKKYLKKNNVEEKFIQHGSTWFNNWEDWFYAEEKEVQPASARRFFE